MTVTQYREGKELIDVVARAEKEERLSLTGIKDLNVAGAESTRSVPLGQVAEIRYGLEEGIIWRRDRQQHGGEYRAELAHRRAGRQRQGCHGAGQRHRRHQR